MAVTLGITGLMAHYIVSFIYDIKNDFFFETF